MLLTSLCQHIYAFVNQKALGKSRRCSFSPLFLKKVGGRGGYGNLDFFVKYPQRFLQESYRNVGKVVSLTYVGICIWLWLLGE